MDDVLNIVMVRHKRKPKLSDWKDLRKKKINHRKEATKPERLLPDGAR
jgi:hypothetical protein